MESPNMRPTVVSRVVVFKIGGSLLNMRELRSIVRAVLAQRPLHCPLLVIGGGAAADVVRAWHGVYRLPEEASHQLALEAMALNEALLQILIPELRPVRSRKQFQAIAAAGETGLLCADCFLRWAESPPAATNLAPLPHNWKVTSDSIAAWAALCLCAEELVLVKSVPVPETSDFIEAAARGLVDAHFPHLAPKLPSIGWVNARVGNLVIEEWGRSGGTPKSVE